MNKKVTLTCSLFLISTFLSFGKELSSLKVYDSIIFPVLEAKCVSCHGAEKDKGKLRMHNKEALIKGGRGAGEDIIIKGDPNGSEIIFRITLPKEDEEAMPPMEDEAHYNPVTPQELSVLKSWIQLGASFDAMISDLEGTAKEAAEHVLKNLPKKILSATAAKIPVLPEVETANPAFVRKVKDAGILIMPIAQNTNALYVNASYLGKDFDDEKLLLLKPLAKQLVWLNLARTNISGKAGAIIEEFTLLTRLHLENTTVGDSLSSHLSKLVNLKYLNLYGTSISDESLTNLQKLKNLEKIFLWQTKVTQAGAANLRKAFVDVKIYESLKVQHEKASKEIERISESESKKIASLQNLLIEIGAQTKDNEPINDKCPVSNKALDKEMTSVFEGRLVGFCCKNCKGKFDKDSSSFRSKITNFAPSENYQSKSSALLEAKKAMDQKVQNSGEKLREISGKLASMGPEINLGWDK